MTSRHAFAFAVLVAVSSLSAAALAQTYPSRPITMIVPFPAGGTYDAIARVVAEDMRGSLGQPIIVENITGAGGSIGVGRAANAVPDGYRLVLGGSNTHVLNGALYSLRYDTPKDFVPIAPLGTVPLVLFARKAIAASDLKQLIAWVKANPKSASAGYSAASGHLLAAFFQKEIGTQFTLVPYRGGPPARQDLVAGQIDLLFDDTTQLPLMRAGQIKAYAVASDTRLALAPEVPTFVEMGLPALSYSGWFGLFAPRGTPRDIIDKLSPAVVGALADSSVRFRLADIGVEVLPRERQTPDALRALVEAGIAKWWPIIKELGIKGE
jgi:tripartite-type tricarboxylate transporter receptor subunit TctC